MPEHCDCTNQTELAHISSYSSLVNNGWQTLRPDLWDKTPLRLSSNSLPFFLRKYCESLASCSENKTLTVSQTPYSSTSRVSVVMLIEERRGPPSFVTVLVACAAWCCAPCLDREAYCFHHENHGGKGTHMFSLKTAVLTTNLFNCQYDCVQLKPPFPLTDALFPTRKCTLLW